MDTGWRTDDRDEMDGSMDGCQRGAIFACAQQHRYARWLRGCFLLIA